MPSALSAARAGEPLLQEGYRRAVALLRRNSTPAGILACTPGEKAVGRHYISIFGRDAAICALGMAASEEPDLIAAAEAGLRTLARHQAANGQIPKYVKPETGEADFWYSGCIDATLWWLIAVHSLGKRSSNALPQELATATERALNWLHCQEHPEWRLLQQNEASDWADIMPRSGFVLYSNALWYWVKRLYKLPGEKTTRAYANDLFYPYGNSVPGHRRARLLVHYIRNRSKPSPFYLSFVNFSFWGEEQDILGNLLAALTGLADDSRSVRIAEGIKAAAIAKPWPVRVVGRPIGRDDVLWRRYMQRHEQNYPFQYHNGGCWPFAGGFWALLLHRLGWRNQGWQALEQLAAANQVGGWGFNEWLHGESGEPLGMPGQSWNAALYILARQALGDKNNFLRFSS